MLIMIPVTKYGYKNKRKKERNFCHFKSNTESIRGLICQWYCLGAVAELDN